MSKKVKDMDIVEIEAELGVDEVSLVRKELLKDYLRWKSMV